MFFVASKLAWLVATPSTLLAGLALIGVACSGARRRVLALWGRRLALACVAGLVVLGVSPAANWLLLPLEERFSPPTSEEPLTGIVVLGGAVRSETSFARGRLSIGGSGDRVVAMADLARRHPAARIVFSGGSGALLQDEPAEADALERFGATLGIDPGRILFEPRSRTTWENAIESRALVQPKPGERWLLVTSARHMPRAMGAFRAAGFPATPYPVDYVTSDRRDLARVPSSVASGLDRFDLASREWVGLLAYRLSGRSDALFPGPASGGAMAIR